MQPRVLRRSTSARTRKFQCHELDRVVGPLPDCLPSDEPLASQLR
jgi:hypothetical protein